MGQVIARKIKGMNLWAKVALTVLFTFAISVFMYEGWFKPKDAPAATVTYYMTRDTSTDLTADGTCNVTGITPYTSTGVGKTTTATTEYGTGSRYYPATTGGSSVVALNVYTPVYASGAVDISAISASAALRGLATSDTVKLDLYDYNPAGAAGNGTLVASSAAKTLTNGTNTGQYTWAAGDFTINGTGRVAQGHRLQFRFTWYSGTTGTPRVYFGVAGTLTSTNFTVTETAVSAATAPTLTSPTATSITNTTATLGANVTSNGGATLTARGTVWGTAAAPTGNAVAEGGTSTGSFTQARTSLTAGTKIYYRGYATNSAGTGYSPDGSFYTEAATQASGVNFTGVSSTGMTVNWTRGTGDGVIVLMKAASAVNSNPVDGTYTGYTANTAFGSGTQIGTGNYVVYKGTGTSVPVTGLTANTTYYVAVYEYKGAVDTSGVDQGANYKLTPATSSQLTPAGATAPTLTSPTAISITNTTATLGANVTADGGAAITARGTVWGTAAAPTGNAVAEGGTTTGAFTHSRTGLTAGTRIYYRGYATNSAGTGYSTDGSFYTEPTTQASGVNFTSITGTGMTVNWTRGSGTGVIVLVQSGSAVDANPVDGTYSGYTANLAFGSGTQVGSGNYVVYKGTGTSAAITGLSSGTTYYVAVFEYAGSVDTSGVDQGTNYKLTAATGSQTTTGTCTRVAPTVSLGGNALIPVNGQKAYTLTVTNNDSAACSASTFALSIPSETGNTVSFILPSVLTSTTTGSLAAQGTYQTTFTVKAQAAATLGHVLTSTVNAADSTNHASQTGSGSVVSTIGTPFSSDLMHNANNLNSTYRSGSWGNDKDCTWCHSADTTNVKRIANTIQTLEGPKTVVFNRMTSAVHNVPGVMGDDQRTYATNASTNVCEVCHHNTTYHQYSGSKVGVPVQHASHPNNNKDCTGCHAHANGFKADCSSCHGFPPTVTSLGGPNGLASPATLALGASPTNAGAHAAHETLGMLCATCHNAYTSGVSHPSTSIQIDFAMNNTNWPGKFAGTASFGTFSGNAPTGGSPAAASVGGTTIVRTTANNTNNSCNVYCHGDWAGSNGSTNPRWAGGASQANCGTCHGASKAQAPQTGSHTVHASNSSGNYGFNCSKCHATVTDGADGHLNGSVQWRLSTASTLIGANASYKGAASGQTSSVALGAAFGDCANIYCHSNGLSTSPTYVSNLTWGTASEGNCGTCHGVLSTSPPASTAHAKHVATAGGYLIACATCHFNVANTTANSTTAATIKATAPHVNRVYDAYGASNFNTAVVGTTATSCQTTYCHSQGTGWTSQAGDNRTILAGATNPTWASGASCAMCHTGGTSTGPSYTSGTPKANSHAAHSTAGYTCDVCHYATTTTGTTITTPANHANRVYNVTANTSKTGAFTYTYALAGGTCANTYCHGASIAWGTSIGGTGDCDGCHSPTTATTTFEATDGTTNSEKSIIHVSHINKTHNIMNAGLACSACHTVPTLSSDTGHIDTVLPAEVPIASALARTGGLNPVFNTGTKACTNTYCHGASLSGGDKAPMWTTSPMTGNPEVDCELCHAYTPPPAAVSDHNGITLATECVACHDKLNAAGTAFIDGSHLNGVIDGGSCLGCHSSVKGTRTAVTGQFASQSHHIQGRAVTNADCYQCHWEADVNGKTTSYHQKTTGAVVNLVVWNGTTRPGTYTLGTTAVEYTANGTRAQIAKINNQCLSCHNTQNAAVAPFVAGSTTDKYSPEARLATPKAKTSILSRYSSTVTVPWSIYNYSSATGSLSRFGTNQKNRTTKALSAHGNAVNNQMPAWSAAANGPGEDGNMTDYTVNGKSANRNVLCFDCHNSHGSAASGITSSYSSATGKYKGGLLKTTEAGLGGYATTYTPATTTVSYRNYSSTTLNTTATFNPGANICNDCHNSNVDAWKNVKANKPWDILRTYSSSRSIGGYWSTPYFDNYTFNSTKRSPYKAGRAVNNIKDLRHPMGGHYGSSINGQSAAASKTVNGLCTPCHDPHGVSKALGTDRDHGVPLLKGTWVTSPYREDKADALIVRGGGRNAANFGLKAAIPGYHIDQNTFMRTPAPLNGGAAASSAVSHKRAQRFRSFSNLSSAQTGTNMPNLSVGTFGGLCLECHNQTTLTGSATRPSAASAWKTKERVHQSVAGWSATASGTDNLNNRRHAFTCAKCHTPHVSRLPRLMVTNCLDARHYGKQLSTTISSVASGTTNAGYIIQSTLTQTALGAGRFPGGGSRYSGTPNSAQNPGGWWFQTNGAAGTTQPTTQSWGSNCHNSATAGGATYNPVNQMWNNKTRW